MATVSVRVSDDEKRRLENSFSSMGLSISAATNAFYHQVLNQGKIPFELRALDDTDYLNSIPGMAESIVDGLNAPNSEYISVKDLKW